MSENDGTWWTRTPEQRRVDLECLRDAVARSGTVADVEAEADDNADEGGLESRFRSMAEHTREQVRG